MYALLIKHSFFFHPCLLLCKQRHSRNGMRWIIIVSNRLLAESYNYRKPFCSSLLHVVVDMYVLVVDMYVGGSSAVGYLNSRFHKSN